MQASAFLCSLTKAILPVSHFKERKETNCLNCNAEVLGKYCYICGQENTPPRQSVGHLINHFLNDITHFDGKFFATLGTLIRRPGLLTLEYVRGRRVSYLDPIRMYIFTSAVFFIVFFNSFKPEDSFKIDTPASRMEKVAAMNDSGLRRYSWQKFEDSTMKRQEVLRRLAADTLKGEDATVVQLLQTPFRTSAAYDSAQHLLSKKQQDGWLWRTLLHRQFLINEKFRKNPENFATAVSENILHSLPKLLFVSLPLFALVLKLLYRRQKNFFYTDHGIFSIHLYILTFLCLLTLGGIGKLNKLYHLAIYKWLALFLALWIFIYLYKAMRHFYGQRRGKTILKFVLLNGIAFFMILVLFLIFLIISAALVV